MTITYMPDHAFHDTVSKVVAAACPEGSNVHADQVDLTVTEALLASGIWPNSWANLMTDAEKAALITRIVGDRQVRIRVPAISRPDAA